MAGVTDARAKAEWVLKALGVDPETGGSAPSAADLKAVVTVWRDATAAVDAQIGALSSKLRSYRHPDLDDIAEYGLNALTAGHKTKILAGLVGVRSGAAADRAKLDSAIDAFIKHLQSDSRVAAVDGNPFGVKAAIGATLIPALQGMKRSLTGSRA